MNDGGEGGVGVRDITAELRRFVLDDALPLWAGAGRDRRHGGVHERLHFDGTPDLPAVKRLRVQARQIYVYAHAAALGWYPDGRRVAFEILEFLLDRGRAPDGRPGYVHLLTPEGAVADGRRDTYDHMFVVLALAWLARASGDAQVRRLVDDTLATIDELFDDGAGGYFESLPRALPRRQNPHMHAFEAMLALHETLAHPAAPARLAALRGLLERHFIDAETGLLIEHLDAALSRYPPPQGDLVEPGHMAEWVWLLRRQEALFGLPPGDLAGRLLAAALGYADAASGYLPDEARRAGPVVAATRRCWPQTELAKAWTAEALAGRPDAAGAARRALVRLKDGYLCAPVPGGWIDQFDANGRAIATHMPASTLYHVLGAAVEAERLARGAPARDGSGPGTIKSS